MSSFNFHVLSWESFPHEYIHLWPHQLHHNRSRPWVPRQSGPWMPLIRQAWWEYWNNSYFLDCCINLNAIFLPIKENHFDLSIEISHSLRSIFSEFREMYIMSTYHSIQGVEVEAVTCLLFKEGWASENVNYFLYQPPLKMTRRPSKPSSQGLFEKFIKK